MARQSAGQAVATYVRKYLVAPRYRPEQRLRLAAADGVRLCAWYLKGPPDAPATVVLVHGLANWSRSPRIHAFAQLLAQRVHVVVPDLRGHGDSEGTCTLGWSEPLDVAAAVAAAPAQLPVVTVGVSLGGAAVLLHAATNPGTVAGVVAVSAPCGWTELDGKGSYRVQRWVRNPAGRLVLATLLRTRLGPDCRGVPSSPELAKRIAPAFTIVVHDPDDWYFSRAHAERLYEWLDEPKELWWLPGHGHGSDLLTPQLAARLLVEIDRRSAGG